MKFVLFNLLQNIPNKLTGKTITTQQFLQNTIRQAKLAESLGYDGYGVGERHGTPFLSSSPAVLLTAIAANTEPSDRHPHCHWTVVIDDSHPEVPMPEPMTHIERTVLASLPLAELGVGATAAEKADGWNDYTAPLDPDLQTEQFSTAALRAMAEEVCVQQHLLVASFCFAIERRYGTEDAVGIVDRQFTGISGLTARRLRDALGGGDGTPGSTGLAEVAQVLELHPAFRPRTYVGWTVSQADDGSSVDVGLGDCPALHESGFETWITRLADGHDDGLRAAVEGVTPFGRVQATGEMSWRIILADEPVPERPEVALAAFSTGAGWQFRATPVTLAARSGGASS